MKIESYFYKDKPLFGLDIGYSSIKIMQIDWADKKPYIAGYGVQDFDPSFIDNGKIVEIEGLVKAAHELFSEHIVGEITTPRVAIAVPASRTFSRVMKLPKLKTSELAEAVRTEAEQYIPVPVDNLYLDYDIISSTEKESELFSVAIPRQIIDSYDLFARALGLETVAMESSVAAAARMFLKTPVSDVPSVLIDFGSISTDITIFDKTLIVTGTVEGGGDLFSERIAERLGVSAQEANVIKIKYGLDFSKKQKEILEALQLFLDQLLKELRRMMRYYEERYGNARKLSQVVTMGGGANMPGLNDYLTNHLRLPVSMSDPWEHLGHTKLKLPDIPERSMYVTVAGVALINPKEIFL